MFQGKNENHFFFWQDENNSIHTFAPDDGVLNNLTLVTAYFDIGSFIKGRRDIKYHNYTYFGWFKKFGHLNNPLVVYTDSSAFARHAARVRTNLKSCTRIVEVSRDMLWAFRLRSKVAELYDQRFYPKFHPNTVNPDYTCAMHAKFAVMRNAILNRYFPSVHYAWVDVGCFRHLTVVPTEEITLVPPPDLNSSRVMYSEVYNANFNLTPSQIFYENKVWVGGASFVGKRDVILQFTEQYERAAKLFLQNNNLSSTDQQVIYSMYTEKGRKLVMPQVELQTVKKGWFGVGSNHCIRRSKEKHPACVNF